MSESPERIGHFPGHQQKFGTGKKQESQKKDKTKRIILSVFFLKYNHQAKLKNNNVKGKNEVCLINGREQKMIILSVFFKNITRPQK